MGIDKVRRDALALWLRGVRLPLTAAEAVLKRGEDTTSWPPALAFRKVEATVNGWVGSTFDDDALVGLARLQRAEVEQREQATVKRAQADAIRAEAQAEAEAAGAELERQREHTEQLAEQREDRLEREREKAEQAVAHRASAKRSAARKQAAKRGDAIDGQATKAEAERLRRESAALRAKEKAVAAEGAVLDLDKAARAKKAARRAG